MKKIKGLKMRMTAFALAASSTMVLCGCEHEMAPAEDYDIVSMNNDGSSEFSGLSQILDVPGYDFKLITEYSCDDTSEREWRITSDKFLYLKVYTEGLPAGTEVYIDNVHIDTSIKSKYAVMDGIMQDTMDDHVHSSQLIGFPISDDVTYYGVNAIEGCNQQFMQLTTYGYNGYYHSTAEVKRWTEQHYLNLGVYANKIQIVYDLLIKGPNDKDFANVSVSTDFIVPITTNEDVNEVEQSGPQKTK